MTKRSPRRHPCRTRRGSGALAVALIAAALAAGTACTPGATIRIPAAGPASANDTTAAPTMPPNLDGPYPVTRVIDGDTLVITRNGNTEKIRLIGVDTPELHDPRKPVECYAQQASDYTKSLQGQQIYLETDPTQDSIDRYGRTLAYIWTDTGRLINYDLIADGYAHEYTYNDPYRYQSQFQAAQQHAQSAQSGLWAPHNCP